MLAYQMKFSTTKLNAMILPIPVAKPSDENALKFISLKDYEDFFEDLNKGFPSITQAWSRGLSVNSGSAIDNKLEVHEVGDFIASFVPTMKDFSRLDQQFVIPKDSWDQIPVYKDYGFAVFQLKELKGTTHPMAFQFKTRFKDQIFFPTVHIHDGKVHNREKFDHTLYLQSEEFDKKVGKYSNHHLKDEGTGFVRSRWQASGFCEVKKTKGLVLGNQLMHRLEMKGTFANKDVIANLNQVPFQLGDTSLGKFWALAPIAACIGGLGWLLNRRNKIPE